MVRTLWLPNWAGRIVTVQTHCRHCRRRKAGKPRGLCWACYQDRSVRRCYPSAAQRAAAAKTAKAAAATQADPGSREKIRVLRERVRWRVSLWHPEDRVIVPRVERLKALLEDCR